MAVMQFKLVSLADFLTEIGEILVTQRITSKGRFHRILIDAISAIKIAIIYRVSEYFGDEVSSR
jgi:hypothetical protein